MVAVSVAGSAGAAVVFDNFSVASDSGFSGPSGASQSAAVAWGSSLFATGSTRTAAAFYSAQVAVANGSANFNFSDFGFGRLDYNAAAGTSVDLTNAVFSVTLAGHTSLSGLTISVAVFSTANDRKQFDITISPLTPSNPTFTFNVNDVPSYSLGTLNAAAVQRVSLSAWGNQASFDVTNFTVTAVPAPAATALLGMAAIAGGRRRRA